MTLAALAAHLVFAMPFAGQGITVQSHPDLRPVCGFVADACVDFDQPKVIHCQGKCEKYTLTHELGHVLDGAYLTPDRRRRVMGYMRRTEYDPEVFAELFAACALNTRPRFYGVKFRPWVGKRGRRVCVAVAKWSTESARTR